MRSTITRALGVGLSAAAISLIPAAGAFADTDGPAYPPSAPAITISQSAVEPGGSVVLTFAGFDPGADVDVSCEVNQVFFESTVTADADGEGTVAVDVPDDTASGTATCTLTGLSGGEVLVQTTSFEIVNVVDGVDDGDDGDDGALADTGNDVTTQVAIGGGALLIGGGILLAGRRRASELESNVLS